MELDNENDKDTIKVNKRVNHNIWMLNLAHE